MRRIIPSLAVLTLFGGLYAGLQLVAPAISQPGFPSTLSANTVVGRLGVGAGPAQEIPFATLFGQPGLLHGPASSTVGHLATWNNTSGTELADYGAAFLSVPNGGTGAASFTAGRPLFGNGTSAFTLGTLSGNTTKLVTTTGGLATDNCVKIDASGNFIDSGGACGASPTLPPGGRLVLNDAACGTIQSIQQTDIVANGGSICYVPHVSSTLNINGTNYTFATLSVAMNSGHQGAGSAYDIWGVVVGGLPKLCIGGNAWATLTSSISSRSITKASNALYENSATISTCYDGASSIGSFTAGQARYLGSVYATTNGNSQWILNPAVATGGTANVLGLYNAYNRVRVQAVEREATPNWTYGTATWRCVQNSCLNKIITIDGLGLSRVEIQHLMTTDAGGAGVNGGTTNVCIDCSPAGTPGSGPTGGPTLQVSNQAGFSGTSQGQTLPGQGFFTGIGVHTFVMIEIGGGGAAQEWFGNTFSGMFAALEN